MEVIKYKAARARTLRDTHLVTVEDGESSDKEVGNLFCGITFNSNLVGWNLAARGQGCMRRKVGDATIMNSLPAKWQTDTAWYLGTRNVALLTIGSGSCEALLHY